MKKLKLYFLYLTIPLVFATQVHSKLLDRIIAVVEEDVIMQSELEQRVLVLIRQFEGNPEALPPKDVIIDQVLQRLIMERIQLQHAERRGIQIDDLSLDQTMRNLAKRNRLSLDEFRKAMVQQGIDYNEFREQIRNEMMLDQLRRREIDNSIQVSDEEIDELVKKHSTNLLQKDYEYLIAHILIAVPENPNPQQLEKSKRRASLVYERALTGSNFSQLAIAASDAQDALSGGNMGWREKGQLPEVFLQQIDLMNVGDISRIATSASGFHIFKIVDRKEIENTMVDQVLVRHILIKTNALMTDELAERKLAELRSRITRGDDFADLARANSEDPGTAVNGGDLPWSVSTNYAPRFQNVVDNLALKEISQPFQSRFGWHIVQLLDKRKHDNTNEAMRNMARQQIRQRKIEEETELWLRRLRDESFIDNRLHADKVLN